MKLNANANGLLHDGQYNIFFRRVRSFVPEEWKGIPSLIPNADELYYGLLDPRDKMKLNNVVDLGHVTTSATAENWAKNPTYLSEKQRPTIFQYFDTRNQQVGIILSLPGIAIILLRAQMVLCLMILEKNIDSYRAFPLGRAYVNGACNLRHSANIPIA